MTLLMRDKENRRIRKWNSWAEYLKNIFRSIKIVWSFNIK